jgi:hypothetical protein
MDQICLVSPVRHDMAVRGNAKLKMKPGELYGPGLYKGTRSQNCDAGVVRIEEKYAVARSRHKIENGKILSRPTAGSSNTSRKRTGAIENKNLTLRYRRDNQDATITSPGDRDWRG